MLTTNKTIGLSNGKPLFFKPHQTYSIISYSLLQGRYLFQ